VNNNEEETLDFKEDSTEMIAKEAYNALMKKIFITENPYNIGTLEYKKWRYYYIFYASWYGSDCVTGENPNVPSQDWIRDHYATNRRLGWGNVRELFDWNFGYDKNSI
jgi:hypothetical protein